MYKILAKNRNPRARLFHVLLNELDEDGNHPTKYILTY